MDCARRIVVISDTHLGKPGRGAGTADALRPLWAGADELIVNGDLAELADPKYRASAARHVLRLQELCQRDGVELTLLSGNHDPLITDRRHLFVANGQVFITHGDVLHPAISPWNASAGELRRFNEEALSRLDRHTREEVSGQLAACQHAAHTKWHLDADYAPTEDERTAGPPPIVQRARKILMALWYWHTLPQRAMEFAAEHAPDARFFIFGHIHRAGIWTQDDRVIINTGSYGMPLKARAVVIQPHLLTVRPIVTTPDRLHCMGNEPLGEWALEAPGADESVRAIAA